MANESVPNFLEDVEDGSGDERENLTVKKAKIRYFISELESSNFLKRTSRSKVNLKDDLLEWLKSLEAEVKTDIRSARKRSTSLSSISSDINFSTHSELIQLREQIDKLQNAYSKEFLQRRKLQNEIQELKGNRATHLITRSNFRTYFLICH